MAEPRPTRGPLQVHVDYWFDRLHESKLAQAYSILVPVRDRHVGGSVKEVDHEDGGNLRTGFVRAAARSKHDCESDGIVARSSPRDTTWRCPKSGSSKMTA